MCHGAKYGGVLPGGIKHFEGKFLEERLEALQAETRVDSQQESLAQRAGEVVFPHWTYVAGLAAIAGGFSVYVRTYVQCSVVVS